MSNLTVEKGELISLEPTEVVLNNFIELDSPRKSIQRTLLLFKTTVDFTKLELVDHSRVEHTSDCVQYLVSGPEKSVIGTLILTNRSLTKRKPLQLSVQTRQDTGSSYESIHDPGTGGIHAYRNDEGSMLFIPISPPESELRVT